MSLLSQPQTNLDSQPQPQPHIDHEELERWFVARLARSLKIEADQIELHEPFLRYGLDSVESVRISADLEGWLGFQLDKLILEFTDAAGFLAYVAEVIAHRDEHP